MSTQPPRPGTWVTVSVRALVWSQGHDDAHVIVKIGGTPVNVPVSSIREQEK